eukprot:gene3314-3590_t
MSEPTRGRRRRVGWQLLIENVSQSGVPCISCKVCGKRYNRTTVYRHVKEAHATEQQLQQAFNSTTKGTGVYLFNRADKAGDEQISTDRYGKAIRQNYHVQVSFRGGRNDASRPFVSVVKRLLWIRHPCNPAWDGMRIGDELSVQQQVFLNRDLRLALVDVYPAPTAVSSMLRIANKHNIAAAEQMRPVSIQQIDAKLVKFEPQSSSELYFTRYSNMSKLR